MHTVASLAALIAACKWDCWISFTGMCCQLLVCIYTPRLIPKNIPPPPPPPSRPWCYVLLVCLYTPRLILENIPTPAPTVGRYAISFFYRGYIPSPAPSRCLQKSVHCLLFHHVHLQYVRAIFQLA